MTMILPGLFERRSDLPLEKDASRRFLPWLVALNVYLAVLALAGLMVVSDAAGRWDRGLSGTLTVQIPPADNDDPAKAATASQARIDHALEILRGTPGIDSARALDRKELGNLMEPWLGSGDLVSELPLPALIDVRLKEDSGVNVEGLSSVLSDAVPGSTIDDHKKWLDRLILLARSMTGIAATIVLLIGGAAIATVIFITRTGLSLHHDVVELLHVMGAQDDYVARQFESQALALCLKGGVAGFALAALTLLALGALVGRLGSQLLPPVELSPVQWLVLAALPLIVALIGRLTARVIVLRSLARLM
jgi:cell division transport system permease protein